MIGDEQKIQRVKLKPNEVASILKEKVMVIEVSTSKSVDLTASLNASTFWPGKDYAV